MVKNNKRLTVEALVLAVFLTGCATSITLTAQRPPALNTLGIQSIAVIPFETSDNSSLQRQAASWLSSEAQTRIQGTNQFNMVAYSQIEQYRLVNENLGNHVDALFIGKVVSLSVHDSSRPEQRTNYQTKETYTVTVYERQVDMEFEYYLTRTRDGSIIGPVRKAGSASDSDDYRSNLPASETLVRNIITKQMSTLARDVAPYTVTEKRSLMKETTKDKAIKERAKNADALAKSGSYRAAQEAYLGIYQDTRSFSAAYNASVLIAAQGDMEGAAAFMQRVYSETGNPQANTELVRFLREIENAGLVAAYSENQGQRDRLIARMVDTLPAILPRDAKIAVINNSRNDRDLADTITNGIISGFLAKNITVVDRSSQALVEAERNYQLSGYVSDDDLIGIGNEAGVNTFILVAVTGSFSTRRLFVRMLDVERNTILYQSPQTDEMNL